MSAFVSTILRSPRTLPEADQDLLLKITGDHRRGFRDHMIISVCLGTGIRQMEIAGLDVGDVLHPDGTVRRRIDLRVFKRASNAPAAQVVPIPDGVWYKLRKFVAWKRTQGESLAPDAPLFVSQRGKRISKRGLRYVFRTWQTRAGIEQPHRFHGLRHSACTNLYRLTKDLRVVQAFARHKSIVTTQIYTEPTIDDVAQAARGLRC